MIWLAIILGLLPGFAWLLFYLKEDLHPEPKKLIAFVFLGGILSTLVAYLIQCSVFTTVFSFKSCDADLGISVTGLGFLSGLFLVAVLALIEEAIKFGTAYAVVNKNTNFDEPVDAMIYTVVAALGFATVENFAIAQKLLAGGGVGEIGDLGSALGAISLRFVGATLLHALASGIAGYYWAVSIREFEMKRFILKGILLATALHTLFNYFIIKFDDRVYTIVLLVAVGLLVVTDFEKLKRRSI